MAKWCKTLGELANSLEVSSGTLRRWRQEWGGFPKRSKRGWNLDTVQKWRAAKSPERSARKRANHRLPLIPEEPSGEPEKPTKLEQAHLTLDTESKQLSNRYRLAKAEQEELRLAQLRGELILKADVEDMFATRVHEVSSRLDGLGRALAPKLLGLTAREIEKEINRATRAIREHFARSQPLE